MAEALIGIAIGSALIGGGLGAVQSISSARQQNAQIDAQNRQAITQINLRNQEISARNAQIESNARTAEINANIASQNRALEARRQDRQANEARRRFALLQGETIAQSGALGTFGGSTLDILADIENQELIDQVSIADEGFSAQRNFSNQRLAALNEAANLRATRQDYIGSYTGTPRGDSGTLGAVSSIIGGIGQAAMIGVNAGGFMGGSTSSASARTAPPIPPGPRDVLRG